MQDITTPLLLELELEDPDELEDDEDVVPLLLVELPDEEVLPAVPELLEELEVVVVVPAVPELDDEEPPVLEDDAVVPADPLDVVVASPVPLPVLLAVEFPPAS